VRLDEDAFDAEPLNKDASNGKSTEEPTEFSTSCESSDFLKPYPKSPISARNWSKYNNAKTHEKPRFMELLADLCATVDELPRPPGAGRNRIFFADMMFAIVFKVYDKTGGRRFMPELEEARQKKYITRVPQFNSLFNYLSLSATTDCLYQLILASAKPLRGLETMFAVDATGFSTGQYSRWLSEKDINKVFDQQLTWRKLHLICGTKTQIVTGVEVTDRHASDHNSFGPLVTATAGEFNLKAVLADKAYLSKQNYELVAAVGGRAYIPFKSTSKLGDEARGEVWRSMFYLFHLNKRVFDSYYNNRVAVESTFSAIKRNYGERLRSKGGTAQVNEILCKVLCHNICVLIGVMEDLGIDVDFQRNCSQMGLPS
jgi:transposase